MDRFTIVTGAQERNFGRRQAVFGKAGIGHQRQRLQGLQRRTGKDRIVDVANVGDQLAVTVNHRNRAIEDVFDIVATSAVSNRDVFGQDNFALHDRIVS